MEDIKEKTADEMFEELGYEKHVRYLHHEENEIEYFIDYQFATSIRFNLESRTILIYMGKNDEQSGHIRAEEIQAINKKCKELGWI